MIKRYCDVCEKEEHLLPTSMDGASTVFGPAQEIDGIKIVASAAPRDIDPLQGFVLCEVCLGNLLARYIEELNQRRRNTP